LTTPRIDDLYSFQSHYAATVLPGAEWAKGHTVFRLNYGFWMTFAIGFGLKLFNLTGFPPPSFQFLFQLFQLFTIISILLILYILNRRNYLLFMTVALFLLTPYLNTAAVWSPNQTGLPYLPFLGGIWLLIWIAKRGDNSIISSAGIVALLALASPDSAVPLLSGFILFKVLIEYK
jgi:hypothetical protein